MRISIFGMGYVGAVSGACLARLGHEVIGVDVNKGKIDTINKGGSPVVEEGLPELMQEAHAAGRISATDDPLEAVRRTDISLISVGTPTGPDGNQVLSALDSVLVSIGKALRQKSERHTVVVRSTVLPRTTENHIAPMLAQASGRKLGEGLDVGFNPEFLREGAAIKDFFYPPFVVMGGVGREGCDGGTNLYSGIDAPFFSTTASIAEALKYACNAYHAVKIVFANELGTLMKAMGIDAREAMRLFCEERQLNISSAYLRPGFAFGGSCLPKELRAIGGIAKSVRVEIPMLANVLSSNDRHVDRAFEMIQRRGRRKVALFGLAFKPGTDDLRESPLVTLAERLIGKGFELAIFDRSVDLARLTGTNLEYIEREIPHLDRLVTNSVEETLAGAGTIVIGHAPNDAIEPIVSAASGRCVIDLQGVRALQQLPGVDYDGICW